MRGRIVPYSQEELGWIEENCEFARRDLHRLFVMFFDRPDVTIDQIKALCCRKGWKTGRTGCFAKGSIPANKGKKMPPGSMHPNSIATRFKKGQRPATYKGPGHEYIDNKDGYVWLIIAGPPPANWRSCTNKTSHPVLKHRYLWEKANGPIPKGHVLKCLDGDKTNCEPSNWACIPQALLPRLAGRHTMAFDEAPAELKPTLLATALLEHEARQARRRIGKLSPQERYYDRRKAQRAEAAAA